MSNAHSVRAGYLECRGVDNFFNMGGLNAFTCM